MTTFNITGDDTFTAFNRIFKDFATADVSTFTFNNNIVDAKTGKNQNTIYAKNETGNNAEVVLKLMRGSDDDAFMSNLLAQIDQGDFPSFQLGTGQFVKRLGDGQGNVRRDVYNLAGGIITKKPDNKENVEGDTEQGAVIWRMMFARVTKSIQ